MPRPTSKGRRGRRIILDDSYANTRERDFDDAPAPTIRAGRALVLDDGGSYAGLADRDFDDAPAPTVRTTPMTISVEGELPPADPTKPPYRVPSMAEVAAVTGTNGYTVASTFAGCGGSSLGYRMAGFRVGWANEFVAHARDVYAANSPSTVLDPRDIREVTGAEVLEVLGLEVGELDVLDGSPPCQPFSTAGKRDRTWGKVRAYGDHAQRADDLFEEYARLVGELRPRVFVAENVSGLVKGTAKGYFKLVHRALAALGYRVEARLLDAQWLGVPQARQRVILMGVREDLRDTSGQLLEPSFPVPLPYRYSMADALPHLRSYLFDNKGAVRRERDPELEPAPSVTVSGGAAPYHHSVTGDPGLRITDRHGRHGFLEREIDPEEPIPTISASGEQQRVRLEYGPGNRREASLEEPSPTVMARGIGGVREYQATVTDPTVPPVSPCEIDGGQGRVAELEEPVPTVLRRHQGFASVLPPEEATGTRRRFYISELVRLCGFPDDFALHGTYVEQWARLGNSVPPPMMRAVAERVRDDVLRRADTEPCG